MPGWVSATWLFTQVRPGQPEIEQLHAVGSEEDVRRLEIAMDDAAGVQRLECAKHAQRGLQRLAQGDSATLDPAGQRLALQQLHDHEELAVLFGQLVDLADIRMADLCGDPRLPKQPFLQGRMAVHGAEALDGDQTVEPVVPGLEHHAHAAFAELTGQAVLANGRLLGELGAYCRR